MKLYLNAQKLLLVFIAVPLCISAWGQQLVELKTGVSAHLRGLSVVNERILWASGTGGQVGRSIDGGESWNWTQVPGFSKVDFRDIEAFDEKTAVVMGIGSPGYILRTEDGGKNWSVVYKNEEARIFMDAMFFWNDRSGMIVGDPIDGRFFVLRSFDGGRSWREIPIMNRPTAEIGEACFAASGTNIAAASRKEAVFVSGGNVSRFYRREQASLLPLIQGTETTGANSIASDPSGPRKKSTRLVVVGGDFKHDEKDSAVCAISHDGGKTWQLPKRPPFGYRSCVIWATAKRLIACGTSGVDVSEDGGLNWKKISDSGYHVCAKSKKGGVYYLAGAKGQISRLDW